MNGVFSTNQKPDFNRFVKEFLNAWLKLDEINDTDPDRELYPEYAGDWWLVNSMIKESQLFFADLVVNNRPAAGVIDSDYTFLDERLARHYGVDGLQGTAFKRTKLPAQSPYGGILTQASVLKVTANGTVTSPVLRGVYVSERLLGYHPSPPPPSVPAVEPDIRGAATIRELLAKHREDLSCASCHAKIDPLGFVLESYDPVGRWRDKYVGDLPIDSKVKLFGEVEVDDVIGFKDAILARPEEFMRGFSEHLLSYALGRELKLTDKPAIDRITRKVMEDHGRFSTVVVEIAKSLPFRNKTNQKERQ